jgi:hypothetical protein
VRSLKYLVSAKGQMIACLVWLGMVFGAPGTPQFTQQARGSGTPETVGARKSAVRALLGELGALEFRQVRRSPEERLFNRLLVRSHYLRCQQPVGEHLK